MKQDIYIEHLMSRHECPAFIDEVGLGAVFGNHVACAVMIPHPFKMKGVNDSKALKHKDVYKLASLLRRKVIYSFGVVEVDELNIIRNMHRANQIAMIRAVKGLPVMPDALFIDGKFNLNLGIPSYAVIKGDSKVFGIAVASIIAKSYRDHLMMSCGKEYSIYDIKSNKGYRSPSHLMSIRKAGITKCHRSWMPQIRKVLAGEYDDVIEAKYSAKWEKI